MPSRFMVSCAARALGTVRISPSASISTSASVARASISGTTMCGRSASISARSAAPSLMATVCARCATWWPGASA